MPGYRDVEIIERSSGRKIQAVYATDSYQCSRLVEADFGILTVMRNPMHASRYMIGCMGIHGYGSFACYTVLSDRLLLSKLMNIVGKYGSDEGYQILVEYSIGSKHPNSGRHALHYPGR